MKAVGGWREGAGTREKAGNRGLNTRKTFETGTNPIESITLFVCPLVTG